MTQEQYDAARKVEIEANDAAIRRLGLFPGQRLTSITVKDSGLLRVGGLPSPKPQKLIDVLIEDTSGLGVSFRCRKRSGGREYAWTCLDADRIESATP